MSRESLFFFARSNGSILHCPRIYDYGQQAALVNKTRLLLPIRLTVVTTCLAEPQNLK